MKNALKQTRNISLQQTEQVIRQLWHNQPGGSGPGENRPGGNENKAECTVYVVLDGARNKKIQPMVSQSGLRYSCLYEGPLDYSMTLAAPYLVRLEESADFTRELIQQAWGNSWGIFAITPRNVSLISVRRNFKKIAYVLDDNNKKYLFRYYDPRVLRAFLPLCDESENLKQIFGPVSHYRVENETATGLYNYALEEEQGLLQLNCELIALFDNKKTSELEKHHAENIKTTI